MLHLKEKIEAITNEIYTWPNTILSYTLHATYNP